MIKIGKTQIGKKSEPFIVADMSGNHNQSLDRALRIVDEAAKAGVHAIKLQTYTPDTMTIDSDREEFSVKGLELWEGKKLYDLYKLAFTPWDWHEKIFARCKKLGIYAFSTPFDETAVDFLEELKVPVYKIASFENTDLPLLKKIAQTKKPVIISTGMASISEISEAVDTLRNNGTKDVVLLKCTSTYPATPENSNIKTIPYLRKIFNCEAGLSDHTLGIGAAVASVALGAVVIEKHLTLKRSDGGVDAAFSMEPSEMKLLVEETKKAWQALGEIQLQPLKSEKSSSKYRRSIFFAQHVKKGQILTKKDLLIRRPAVGIEPKFYDLLIGAKAPINAEKGEPITLEMFLKR